VPPPSNQQDPQMGEGISP